MLEIYSLYYNGTIEIILNVFRISSDIFPWCSEYGIENSPYYLRIKTILEACGNYAKKHGIRITSIQVHSMY